VGCSVPSKPNNVIQMLRFLAAAAPVSAAALFSYAGQPAGSAVVVAQDSTEPLKVYIGESRVIRPPWPVARVSVTDPDVANVEVLTPEQILVLGKKAGTTDLMAWSADEKVWRTRIDVGIDLARLSADIKSLFPDSEVSVSVAQNIVVLGGLLRRVEEAQHIRAFMEQTGLPYIDRTSIAGVQQVLIRVRVAEVSRKAIRTLGVNAFYNGEDAFLGLTPGPVSGGALTSGGVPNPNISIFGSVPDWDLTYFIQALSENQYLRVLAEPNLKCLSGEEANFLAGGEFPIPIVQNAAGTGTTSNASITIEYKEFGVRLRFRPQVLGDNTIRLQVAPEVSELSDVGAVTIQGFQVPSLLTRRAETTLELKSGQTFAMAGLLSQTANSRNSRIPGFGDLPILGSLFRSVRYSSGETELVVMVTADLVEPLNVDEATAVPGGIHKDPNDWELYAMGKLVGAQRPIVSPSDSQWMNEMGLGRLRGPGAWTRYDQAPALSRATARPERETGEPTQDSQPKSE
jgi:pilus assembly protein CpaC